MRNLRAGEQTMRIIINRMEREIAVCELENGELLQVPSRIFPNVSEGDVIDIKVNQELTEKMKKQNSGRLRSLFNKTEE